MADDNEVISNADSEKNVNIRNDYDKEKESIKDTSNNVIIDNTYPHARANDEEEANLALARQLQADEEQSYGVVYGGGTTRPTGGGSYEKQANYSSEPSDTTDSKSENDSINSSSDNDYSQNNYDFENLKYKKLTHHDIIFQMDKYYEPDIVSEYSSALDILASYLKGQKIIYMESSSYKEGVLNTLMLPAIFLSSLVSVLQSTLNCKQNGDLICLIYSGYFY